MPSAGAAELAFAIQTAKGSPAAASTRRLYLAGGSLPFAQPTTVDDGANRTVRSSGGPITTTVTAAGSPQFYVRPGMIGALLYAVLGGKSVSGAADPWTHTLVLGSSLPYLTVWSHYAGLLNERLSDARVQRLTLTGRAGRPLMVSVDILSGSPAYRTAQEASVAAETSDSILYYHGTGALKLEGAAVATISDFSLIIDANVELVQTLAGPVPMMGGLASVRLSALAELTSASLWARMLYASASPANLAPPTLTPLELAGSPAGVEFTFTEQPSPERSLKLAIPRVALVDLGGMDPDPSLGLARQRLELAGYPSGAASPITATLKNAVASY